jgi:flagellar basal-body rod modification protein FlgD
MAFEITGVSSAADAAALAIQETGDTALGQDTFLRLLTTQLQNQDPTDPVSNEQFVAQLAQFSQLEQLQSLNSQVELLYYVNTSMNNAAMTNLLGQTVVAVSDTFHYDGAGDQTVWYDAGGAATSATLDIYDEDGTLVWSGSMGALAEGEGSYSWDGRGLDGLPVAAGDYTFRITAYDANGNEVEVDGRIRGVVDEMSFDNGSATPTVDGVTISMGDILRLYTESEE